MIARSHYDRDTLARFLDDAPTDDPGEIAEHLEQCDACQSTLESLMGDGLTMETAGALLRDGGTEALGVDFDVEWTLGSTESQRSAKRESWSFLEPSEHPESLGRFARFEIMEILGRGGMGIVMRGYDTSLNRHSAVKVLAPELATSAAARKRFSREAKSAAAVVHPHVVPIQTVDEHNGLPYLVMPVVEGQSVDARVCNSGPVSVIEAVRIASQIAEGLAAAHEQGLVHRDIKPANVLLENGVERVQITDFGLARAIDDASMTRSGVIAGTPQYMSPEQAHGDSIDHRSDLFSLGSLIYFMLTGHSPFRAETTMGVLNRIGNEQPRSLRSINADIPEWFEHVVMKLLAKPREDRFQSASEVAESLQRWHAHLQQPDVVDPPQKIGGKLSSAAIGSGSRGGLVTWLIATVMFGCVAFAGVLIVLELDKGRLTIESEADNVPIRIMQGDEVVKRLTVTKKGTSIRVVSGKYVVEIDGEFSDIHVDSATVALGRREKKKVRIVQSMEHTQAVAGGDAKLSSEELSDMLTPRQVLNHGQQISKLERSITVRFRVGTAATQAYDGIDDQRWYFCSDDNPSELGADALKVWISPALEDALRAKGIADIEQLLAGKTVTVSGQVEASAVMLIGRPTFWVYSMQLETPDQLTVQLSERVETIVNANGEVGSQELPEILTPEQAMNHGQLQVLAMERGLPQKWVDASVTVRFRVGCVARQVRYADYSAWYLCPSEQPSELGAGFLKVWISPAVEAALKAKGFGDLKSHFAGKTVSISGRVTSIPAVLTGTLNSTSRLGPSHLTHSMELESLDQLALDEAPVQPLNQADPDYDRPLAFIFYGPGELKVQVSRIGDEDTSKFVGNGPCPVPFKLVSSMIHAVHVSNFPGMSDYSLTLTLEIRQIEEELYRRLSSGDQIRVDFTEADFEHVISGNGLTKVIYLPSADSLLDKKLKLETIASSRVDDGVDVVAVAESRGKVIAVLRRQTPPALNEKSTLGETRGSKPFNTPTVLAALKGRWQELNHEEGPEFNQTLVFSGGAMGQWHANAGNLPVSITYYVEGKELIVQYNHEPEAAFDYRLKQSRFEYELDGDSLDLSRDGVTRRFKRIGDANAVTTPPQTGALLQAGLAYQDSAPASLGETQ